MNPSFDVVVIGGGIVGLSAALAMAMQGFSVAVIDPTPLQASDSTPNLRVYAINQSSEALFHKLGLWSFLSADLSPYERMHIWDSKGQGSIDFDARDVASPKLGAILSESCLKKALLERLQQEKTLHLYPNSRVNDLQKKGKLVEVSTSEQRFDASLVMISDGANSPSRDLLNVPIFRWPYHQHALVATVNLEKTHKKTAYQCFLPNGPLAFLPLKDEHQASIVWTTTAKEAQHLMSQPAEDFCLSLATAFGNKLGKLSLLSQRAEFPLCLSHVKQYVGENWLMLGDDAHTIHPLAGLGLNLGLADLHWLKKPNNGDACI